MMTDPATRAGMKDPEQRRRFYAFMLLGCIVAIAGFGLLNVWFVSFLGSSTAKVFISLCILAGLSAFLYMFSFGQTDKKSRAMIYTSCLSAVLLSIITLLQIWASLFSEELFFKLIISLLIVGALASGMMALWDDFFENKRLKDENYLD